MLPNEIPKDTVQFWVGVKEYKKCNHESLYEDFAKYALSCLSTPVSNAVVERVFSAVACI